MGIKRNSTLDIHEGVEDELVIAYDSRGMWIDIADSRVFIDKGSMYNLLADMLFHLSSFKEDEEDLIVWLENMLNHLSGGH